MDQLRDLFHRFDFRTQHVRAPLGEEDEHDIRLLASEDLAQLLPVQRGARRAMAGHVREQRIDLAALGSTEVAAVFQQRPAQPLEARIEFVFPATHLVDRRGSVSDHMEVFGDLYVGEVLRNAADEGRPDVDANRLDLGGLAVMGAEIAGKGLDGGGLVTFGDVDHFAVAPG